MQPGGEIFAYDIRLYIPGTEQDVIINLGKTEFYVVEENKEFIPETSVLMQVHTKYYCLQCLNHHTNMILLINLRCVELMHLELVNGAWQPH